MPNTELYFSDDPPNFKYIPHELSGTPEEKLILLSKIHLPSESIIQEAFRVYRRYVQIHGVYPIQWWEIDLRMLIRRSEYPPHLQAQLLVRLSKYSFTFVKYDAEKTELALMNLVHSLLLDLWKESSLKTSQLLLPSSSLRKLDPDFCAHVVHVYRKHFLGRMVRNFYSLDSMKLIHIWNSCKHEIVHVNALETGFVIPEVVEVVKKSRDAELIQLLPEFKKMLQDYFYFTTPFLSALSLQERIGNVHYFDLDDTMQPGTYMKAKRPFEDE